MSEAGKAEMERYPLADAIPQEQLDAEVAYLESLKGKPFFSRLWGYMKLGGPGFIGAGFTIGAGSIVSAMLSGVMYGYKTMWVTWFSLFKDATCTLNFTTITARISRVLGDKTV